ncbi:MAG: cyclic nucleotide-binding domain-containing protein [Steroidobacteraceae bacterium]
MGQVLCESGSPPAYAYFPTTAIVSLVCTMLDGASTETAVVGNDGMVGISLVTGGESVPGKAVVHSAGRAYRLQALAFRRELARGGQVLHTLLRYTLAVIAQLTQTAACNRHHSIEQQL